MSEPDQLRIAECERAWKNGYHEGQSQLQAENARLTSEVARLREDADSDHRVVFYERDFYVLSNFSAFELRWDGSVYSTSEHVYQAAKFRDWTNDEMSQVWHAIYNAPSAHAAFKLAEQNRALRRPDWDAVKLDVMRAILRAKADQHEYVRRKLLATGDRELVENSWRDDYWGWGPNRDGQNMLGKLWMEVRAELRAALAKP